MSWQIPTQIEQDIISGKATYRTFQTGNGGQSILPVPANAYIVIFGYDFSPAGGGMTAQAGPLGAGSVQSSVALAPYETQQISFYTGTDFYPFIHHIDITHATAINTWDGSVPDAQIALTYRNSYSVNSTPISRQVYITSPNDVTITHGLVINARRASANAIPVTSRTPQGLTYGGSGQSMSTQTDYGPGATPQQFMQPSTKDYQDFGFGLLPSNADGQAFATPDLTNGLRDASEYTRLTFGNAYLDNAATNYFLCLHYALYNQPIDSKQG